MRKAKLFRLVLLHCKEPATVSVDRVTGTYSS